MEHLRNYEEEGQAYYDVQNEPWPTGHQLGAVPDPQ